MITRPLLNISGCIIAMPPMKTLGAVVPFFLEEVMVMQWPELSGSILVPKASLCR